LSKAEYLNYSNLNLDKSHFYDLDHLNEKGAVILSNKLNIFFREK